MLLLKRGRSLFKLNPTTGAYVKTRKADVLRELVAAGMSALRGKLRSGAPVFIYRKGLGDGRVDYDGVSGRFYCRYSNADHEQLGSVNVVMRAHRAWLQRHKDIVRLYAVCGINSAKSSAVSGA